MVTYFNKRDMISFGEYLLSDERKERFEAMTDELLANGFLPLPTCVCLKDVHHADFENWKSIVKQAKSRRDEEN